MKNQLVIAAAGIFLLGCGEQQASSDEQRDLVSDSKKEKIAENTGEAKMSSDKKESFIADIDAYRKKVEAQLADPIEIQTKELREKIKQKWRKIHFYADDEAIVRIKTYPYDEISERTEEFYLSDGKLVLAVIEDDGSGERGKQNAELDKLYYFHDDQVIAEISREGEPEFSVRDSDGEELLAEVYEYMKIIEEHLKKGA